MRKILGWALLSLCCAVLIVSTAWAELPLKVVYPPPQHTTLAKQIFLIGTAPLTGTVTVNGQPIERSPAGHFAPSFPLQVGENLFKLQYQDQTVQINVTREAADPTVPANLGFIPESLTPTVNIARLPGELICFTAIAASNATVSVTLANKTLTLTPEGTTTNLPDGGSVLTGQQEATTTVPGRYSGCSQIAKPGNLGKPRYQIQVNGTSQTATAAGEITLLPTDRAIAEVKAPVGVARTGPSTDNSRLTPLPQGTQATITGAEGDWLRLDYGAWIKREEVKIVKSSVPPRSIIRSISSDRKGDWTEIRFPLQVPVPVTVQQDKNRFTLTLHNTTAQTDTIRFKDPSLIADFDWHQVDPTKVEYRFTLTSQQQWGYKLRYAGTTLIVSLRHPPIVPASSAPDQRDPSGVGALTGMKILLDVGHGGPEDLGARGPTGYPEKDAALVMANLLRQELRSRGATVTLSREQDIDLSLADRVKQFNQIEPTLYLSLHYNALPDDGDAIATQGVSTFWFTPQSQDLAVFLNNYLVQKAQRASYGVFWKSLAVARPTVAPAVLLELGFMINPIEFEWIIDPQAQQKLATTLAEGITQWLLQTR
jgi:N-acetylmuramoyl-L-alanine amidase